MKKDKWEITDILSRIFISITIAAVGWYFSSTYQREQQELTKTKLETEILKSAIVGNEKEKILAMKFASLVAIKFEDKEFERIILEISYSEDNTEMVRQRARKRFLELSLDDPDPIIKEIARRDLDKMSLQQSLVIAGGYYQDRLFSKSAYTYEQATSLVPLGTHVDLNILEKARDNIDQSPENACVLYKSFFSDFL